MNFLNKLLNKEENIITVGLVCQGDIVPIEEVCDEVFSSKVMGDGLAMYPSKGEIYAPFTGTINMVFPTRHAVGISHAQGPNLLIHIGMDTVTLNGLGFTCFVSEGDKVRKGDLLVKFDIDYIKSQELNPTVIVLLSEDCGFNKITKASQGDGNDYLFLLEKV